MPCKSRSIYYNIFQPFRRIFLLVDWVKSPINTWVLRPLTEQSLSIYYDYWGVSFRDKYMKSLRIFCFLGVLGFIIPQSGWAVSPWGALDNVEEIETPFAMELLIDGTPVRYAVSDTVSAKQEELFVQNLRWWPRKVAQTIRQQHREQEFAEILPVLQAGVRVRRVGTPARENSHGLTFYTAAPNQEMPHILLDAVKDLEEICGPLGVACINTPVQGNPFELTLPLHRRWKKSEVFDTLLLHELGHFYGLADQYEGANNSHAVYSSDVDRKYHSIMLTLEESDGPKLSCDDIDGFINVFDLHWKNKHGHFPDQRAQKGWRSFCPDSPNIYKDAKTINRKATLSISQIGDIYQYHADMPERIFSLPNTPDGLLTVLPGDRILRDPETQWIRSIKRTIGKNEKGADLIWERQFTYWSPSTSRREIQRKKLNPRHELFSAEIYIKNFIDGKPVREYYQEPITDANIANGYRVLVRRNGSVEGANHSPTGYTKNYDKKHSQSVQVEGGQLTRFEKHTPEYDLTWDRSTGLWTIRYEMLFSKTKAIYNPHTDKWQEIPLRTPTPTYQLTEKEMVALAAITERNFLRILWEDYQTDKRWISSYYTYFYKPIFNQDPPDLTKELQKEIRMHK